VPLPETDGIVVERVQFPAGPYLLEGELAYPGGAEPAAGGVVITGSHPLLGGNMHNNVVRGLGDGLAERNWVTFRFNYRGVGDSQGPRVDIAKHLAQFWESSTAPQEMDLWRDVQGAADFLRSILGPQRPLCLAGYSFGCALLPFVRLDPAAAAVALIAPPLGKHALREFAEEKSPLLVVVSDNDFAVDAASLGSWFDRLRCPKKLVRATLDSHFFRGHEPWLVDTVSAFLQEHDQ
jgi:alpha/beta superfamily hydrolase